MSRKTKNKTAPENVAVLGERLKVELIGGRVYEGILVEFNETEIVLRLDNGEEGSINQNAIAVVWQQPIDEKQEGVKE